MQPPQELLAEVELADSITAVEFDRERELFRATYDSDRDPTSLAVVAVVASVRKRAPRALTPLQSAIETDALDTLAMGSVDGPGGFDSISFSYEGCEVTVFADGVIEVDPVENA